MKRTLRNSLHMMILLLLSCGYALGQQFKTVTLIGQRNYYLNGGFRAAVDGNSRVTLKIELPQNTVYWYYSVTTSVNKQGTELLNLGLQIGALMYTSGAAGIALSKIKIPPGSGAIDAFVMQSGEERSFLDKAPFSYFQNLSLESITSGVQEVSSKCGTTFLLGLRNRSVKDGVHIQLEVVAVVAEPDPQAEKATMYCNMGWAAYERGELGKCLELSEKAVALDPALNVAKFNIALVHLAQQHAGAVDEYIELIASLKPGKETLGILKAAVQDVLRLKMQQPDLKYLPDVEALLLNQLGRY